MTYRTASSQHMGLTLKEHWLTRPWDPERSSDEQGAREDDTFELYARELIPRGGESLPVLVYLQGGPGCAAPRPETDGGLIGEALKHYRVLLLDQRGTGRSARIDNANVRDDVLHLLRQEYIVGDAEALREAMGESTWSLYGQSFGGFCITTYQSIAPESIERAYLTGGLPMIDGGVDELYRATFAKLRHRHLKFYEEYPWAQQRIREVCHHLDHSDETLPTGERLSSRRLRTLGINLGRGTGFQTLAYLFEDPFHHVRGEKRLKTDFLTTVGAHVSFGATPLYATIHESIYGGLGVNAAVPTNWSAHRIREEFPGFEEGADRQRDPFFLTGEHIFPWQFEEDPALHAFKDAAHALAQRSWHRSPYDPNALTQRSSVAAAAVYLDDIFVPFEPSMHTAATYRDLRTHVTNAHQHDGIRAGGAEIFSTLHRLINDH